MWIGGLRGAMAYALAIQSIFDYGVKGKIMLYTTLVFTLITILLIGSSLHPIMERCEVTRKPLGEEAEPEDQSERKCCGYFKDVVTNFNENYFKPLFVRIDDELDVNQM